jgi:hypothetical protein
MGGHRNGAARRGRPDHRPGRRQSKILAQLAYAVVVFMAAVTTCRRCFAGATGARFSHRLADHWPRACPEVCRESVAATASN